MTLYCVRNLTFFNTKTNSTIQGGENLNESFEEPYSPESPAFEPAEGPIPPAPLVLPAPPTAAEEEELQKSVLADLEEPKLKMLL